MKFVLDHNNINVRDLEQSVQFYQEALGLVEAKRYEAMDGSFIQVYLGDQTTAHRIELTWLRDKAESYDLGDNESHIAFKTDDFQAAHELHRKMGCICYENEAMGVYFISDPDGYWLEIMPAT